MGSGGQVSTTQKLKERQYNQKIKVASQKTGIMVINDPESFQKMLTKAKKSNNPRAAWRVDDYSHTPKDYAKDLLMASKGGSTIAVTPDGDIISVARMRGDTAKGKDLLKAAVKNGGVKLDAYEGLVGFYLKTGFRPVSYTKFNKAFAPDDWKKMSKSGRVHPEDIFFFKYTGNKLSIPFRNQKAGESKKDFLNAKKKYDKGVVKSIKRHWKKHNKIFTGDDGYDKAMRKRDQSL